MKILGFMLRWLWNLITHQTPPPSRDMVEGQKLGESQVQAQTAEQTAKAETAVAQAEADAPKTKDAVVDELKRGAF